MFASDSERNETFVRLHSRYQQRIYAFILTLVPNPTDADDILQETGVVLWRKFDEFDLDTDFVHWAHKIAYYEVLKFRTRQGKERLCFDETLIEAMADTTAAQLRVEMERAPTWAAGLPLRAVPEIAERYKK